MAFIRNNIIARPAYAGFESELGGIWDSITSVVKNTVNAYGNTRAAQGAATAAQQYAQVPVAPVSSGPSTTTLLLLGGAGVAAVLLLKKRKK